MATQIYKSSGSCKPDCLRQAFPVALTAGTKERCSGRNKEVIRKAYKLREAKHHIRGKYIEEIHLKRPGEFIIFLKLKIKELVVAIVAQDIGKQRRYF